MFECALPLIFYLFKPFRFIGFIIFVACRKHRLIHTISSSSFSRPSLWCRCRRLHTSLRQILLIICCWYETAVFSKSAIISLFLIIAHKIFITITNTHCKLRSFGACSGFLIDTCPFRRQSAMGGCVATARRHPTQYLHF